MFGFARPKFDSTKKKATIISTVIVIIGVGVTYALGAFVGFLKNGYSQSLNNIVNVNIVYFYFNIQKNMIKTKL